MIPFFFLGLNYTKAQINIVTLGNSITKTIDTTYSYRYNLWKKLVDDGLNFDFVGTQNLGQSLENGGDAGWPDYLGLPFDRDHEGHYGWKASHILEGHPFVQSEDSLSEWLQSYNPDIALVHLGHNDLKEYGSTHNAVVNRSYSRLLQVVDTLRQYHPNIIILFSKLIPCRHYYYNGNDSIYTSQSDRIPLLNDRIANLPVDKFDPSSPIWVVDQYTGFDTVTDLLIDGIHPNVLGEEKMAQKYFDAIKLCLSGAGIWAGTTSNDWSIETNWSYNLIPTNGIDVTIPSSATNWPIILEDLELGVNCSSITMEENSELGVLGSLIIGRNQNLISKGSNSIYILDDIILQPGATFTNGEDNTAIALGDFIMEADANNTASYIDNGSLTIGDSTIVKKCYTDGRWHFVSSPLNNSVSNVFLDIYMKHWSESDYLWNYITATNFPMDPGAGYEIWSTLGNPVVEFSGGTFNKNTLSPIISANDANLNLSIGDSEGWNFVGNPYPSAIDLGTENNPVSGYTWSNLDNTVYFWTGSQYAAFNMSGDGIGTNGGTQYVPSMQGFFVKANDFNPSMTIPEGAKLHSAQDNYKSGSVNKEIRFVIEGNGYSDEMVIGDNEDADDGFDKKFDAHKMYGIEEAPQLYSILPDKNLSINIFSSLKGRVIPVGLEVGYEGDYTITPYWTMSSFAFMRVYLEDTKYNNLTELLIGEEITIIAEPEDKPHRFNLIFKSNNSISSEALESAKLDNEEYTIFSNDDIIYVITPESTTSEIFIYNITGQLVKQVKASGGTENIRMSGGPGYYIVKVLTWDDLHTRKVFIK